MPRNLVFGNGTLLVGIDDQYSVRDLYYPVIGMHNHLAGHALRMGVWVDGEFSWLTDHGWHRRLHYKSGTALGASILENKQLGIRFEIQEGVDHDSPVLLRRVDVHNQSAKEVELRVFFNQDLLIDGSDVGNTAFFHPLLDGIVHYKEDKYFLFGGWSRLGMMDQYSIGIRGHGGLEGTWRDAEDGELAMTPIEQGAVDSTFRIKFVLPPGETDHFRFWLVCGRSLEELTANYKNLLGKGQDQTLAATARHFRQRLGQDTSDQACLPKHLKTLYRQSLYVISTHVSPDGAMIAASDTDIMVSNRSHYGYVWHRDGALISTALIGTPLEHLAHRFFEFCERTLPKEPPMFKQKYNADGTVGSSWHPWIANGLPDEPFQEDETALVLHAIDRVFEHSSDTEALTRLFETVVAPAADFMCAFRDANTLLPLPSYDLWEERRGVHTFTVASVIAGLEAAARIAGRLEDKRKEKFHAAAREIRSALTDIMFDPERGHFCRRLALETIGYVSDSTIDSSILMVSLLGALPHNHPTVVASADAVEDLLWVRSKVGGVARYAGDWYWRVSDHFPGNPWFITTLWLAQYRIAATTSRSDLARGFELLEWAAKHASPSGVLSEQVHAETGASMSVGPLIWSHAEFVRTVRAYCEAITNF